MPAITRYAFATLSLSAKLHRLLEGLGKPRKFSVEFDEHLQSVLHSLHGSPLHQEARTEELRLLRQELAQLEELYQKERSNVSQEKAQTLARRFKQLKERVKEKES